MSDNDSSSEPNSQPRDSRLETFLRRAAGILTEQRQWSAQTQIKLKMLAKELKLPPELFQTALEQLADEGRSTPLTRYEQAFCEYLERQLETLPGEILSRTQERKALAYGQQKFQLTPDACDRCIVRVAEKLHIARISDVQALAYAQGEVSRLVGKSEPSSTQLMEQVQQLALHWGIDPLQAERLLQTELGRRSAKRRRATIYRFLTVVGVVVLSLVLIVCILVLGKILTHAPTATVESDPTRPGDDSVTNGGIGTLSASSLAVPAWWTDRQQALLARLIQARANPDLLAALTSENSQRRGTAYQMLWKQLAEWDRDLLLQAPGQPRWLRQSTVQDALLDWFWSEPDTSAAQVWLAGLDQLRKGDPSDFWIDRNPVGSRQTAMVEAMGDFLTTTAADHLLLRVYQRCLSESAANPAQTNLQARLDSVVRTNPAWQLHFSREQGESIIGSSRQRWMAEATERLYYRVQAQWSLGAEIAPTADASIPAVDAWPKAVATVSESLRLIADEPTRGRLLIMFWSAVAGFDPTLAEASWSEVAAAMEIVSQQDWSPLVESWSATSPESAWSARLLPKWQAIAQANQTTLSGHRNQDAILLQNALPSEPVPTGFQKQMRRELMLSLIKALPVERPTTNTLEALSAWENLNRSVTLAYCLTTESDFRVFDRIVLKTTRFADPQPTNQKQFFVPVDEFDEAWKQLTTARNLDDYQQAVQNVAMWWQQDRLLSIPQGQILTSYLLKMTKPEEQTSWLLVFRTQDRVPGQGRNEANNAAIERRLNATPFLRLVSQPSIAMVLADHYATNWKTARTDFLWLIESRTGAGVETSLIDSHVAGDDGERLIRWLRQQAVRRLMQHEILDRSTTRRIVAHRYQAIFQTERSRRNNRPREIATASRASSHDAIDPMLGILLAHDQWSESLATAILPDPGPWLDEYRRQVDQQALPEQAFWVAEQRVLQLLQQHLASEIR
ncbi:MAG: hypothetical protein Q8M16_05410 [Pirellulaceae bacterium]|nr:hypothetical protein [Pirellulaceae bacterium]